MMASGICESLMQRGIQLLSMDFAGRVHLWSSVVSELSALSPQGPCEFQLDAHLLSCTCFSSFRILLGKDKGEEMHLLFTFFSHCFTKQINIG